MATQVQSFPITPPLWRRTLRPLGVLLVLAIVLIIMRWMPFPTSKFPQEWNLGLRARIDAFQDWVIDNRATAPMFAYFFDPLSNTIDAGIRWTEDRLLATLDNIAAGHFPPRPLKKSMCGPCPYATVCRLEYVEEQHED